MKTATDNKLFRKILRRFIYNLYYPALLGSMIYSIFRDGFANLEKASFPNEVIIAIIFICNWIFLNFYISKKLIKAKHNKLVYNLLDFVIPSLFTLAFFSINDTRPWLFCAYLTSALLFVNIYTWKMKGVRFFFSVMTLSSFIFFIFTLISKLENLIVLNLILIFSYLVIIIFSHLTVINNKSKKKKKK